MKKFRSLIQAVFLMALAAESALFPGAVLARQETGFLDRTATIAGETYRYQVYVPADWDAGKKWPVILFLHGAGERGRDGLRQTDVGLPHALRTRPAEIPAVVVMPQCRADRTWDSADMRALALKALDQAVREFHGDESRLYAAGLSMGGYGVWELAAARTGRFAAYVVVCAGVGAAPNGYPDIRLSLAFDRNAADPYVELARRVGTTPAWIFHGDADPVVPVEESRRMYAALKTSDPNARYKEYPGVGHGSWENAFAEPELFPWLLAQRLPRAGR
jgi:predicted peptidase